MSRQAKKTTTDNDDEFIPNDENSICFSSLHPLYVSCFLLPPYNDRSTESHLRGEITFEHFSKKKLKI